MSKGAKIDKKTGGREGRGEEEKEREYKIKGNNTRNKRWEENKTQIKKKKDT